MTLVKKHSVSIRGHRTSFSLEKPFFDELRKIATERGLTLAALIASVDEARPREANLSSALRIFVLEHVRNDWQSSSVNDEPRNDAGPDRPV